MTDVSLIKGLRELNADDLDIGYIARAQASHGSSAPDAPLLQSDDPRLETILRLLRRFGGVILSGPPGTSKSWLAGQIADKMTGGDGSRRADIQFHASYQFEDFMEGYRPKKDGSGFERRDGVFLQLVRKAHENTDDAYVLVVDELSRADVGRVFGEALTYIERNKRGQRFNLPSGETISIPLNLFLIATMNPLDRGVDDVDAAFERRFAKVDMPPSRGLLEQMLDDNGFPNGNIHRRLLGWFSKINTRATQTPAAAVGHAYFADVTDTETLQEVWDYQLKYLVARAFKNLPETRDEMVNGWAAIFDSPDDESQPPVAEEAGSKAEAP
ncbi:McrB family protein [Streptomyces sp. NPDC091281]|uniref:McrB family protein n=1 Tax=Streptomyces sp. NPDC091281 TaxID=3365985 RepID=UPI0038300AB7